MISFFRFYGQHTTRYCRTRLYFLLKVSLVWLVLKILMIDLRWLSWFCDWLSKAAQGSWLDLLVSMTWVWPHHVFVTSMKENLNNPHAQLFKISTKIKKWVLKGIKYRTDQQNNTFFGEERVHSHTRRIVLGTGSLGIACCSHLKYTVSCVCRLNDPRLIFVH